MHVHTLGTGENCGHACWELPERLVPRLLPGLNTQDRAKMLTFYLLLLLFTENKNLQPLTGHCWISCSISAEAQFGYSCPALKSRHDSSAPYPSLLSACWAAALFHWSRDRSFGTQSSQPALHTCSSPAHKG